MIGFGGLGSRRKPRKFEYKPFYWDEEAELREERRKARELADPNYKAEEDEEYRPGSRIRAQRLRRMRESEKMQSKSGRTLIRTLIFVVLLGAMIFLLADKIALVF